MFSMIGAVEKAGSGADTILKGWDETNFGTPIIYPYTLLSKQIIEYCNSWISNQETAESLGYDGKYLGSRVIPRMVAKGLLEKHDKKSNRSPQ